MAAVNTEVKRVYSPSGVTTVYGTFTTAGGTSSGYIVPGYDANTGDSLLTEGSLNVCRGIRKILSCVLVNTANSNAYKAVIAYDATPDADKVTVTCTANDTFTYVLTGIDQGQNV